MPFQSYTISQIRREKGDLIILQLINNHAPVFDFLPGQFCQIQNPSYITPEETHLFSIASSPMQKKYLELCIKVYGNWTQSLAQKSVGETLKISGPFGKFTYESQNDAVFLAGGIGISPIVSMLRYIKDNRLHPTITLLYGSRTPDTIAYKDELDQLSSFIPNLKIVHILSHLTPSDSYDGYRGFITKDIIEKETDRGVNPTFFICGPPIFVQLQNDILQELHIPKDHIRQELYA